VGRMTRGRREKKKVPGAYQALHIGGRGNSDGGRHEVKWIGGGKVVLIDEFKLPKGPGGRTAGILGVLEIHDPEKSLHRKHHHGGNTQVGG